MAPRFLLQLFPAGLPSRSALSAERSNVARRTYVVAIAFVALFHTIETHGQILRRNGDLIPGTEEIVLGPGVQLSELELEFADLSRLDLRSANLSNANLSHASLGRSNLTSADLSGADLTNAVLVLGTFIDADMSGANLTGSRSDQADFTGANLRRSNLSRTLVRASLVDADLTGANLTGTHVVVSQMTNAIFREANLTDTYFRSGTITGVDLEMAVITGTHFPRGLTREQFYSTVNYQSKSLRRIFIARQDMSGWDFSGADLTDAILSQSNLLNANLTEAIVTGAGFSNVTSLGFTKEQLYSTLSYQAKDLRGVGLSGNDLSDWDFGNQNLSNAGFRKSILSNVRLTGAELTGAFFEESTLSGADLTGAVVTGASFYDTTSQGFLKDQFYSTASYQEKDLQGVDLGHNDLSGWDFTDQDLASASFAGSSLSNALSTNAVITNANFWAATAGGFTFAQLSSTLSYQTKNLRRVVLSGNDLTGWDLSGQDLTGASLGNIMSETRTELGQVDLRGANLNNATLRYAVGLESAVVDSSTTFNQWTMFPRRFNPSELGLTFTPTRPGDFDGDDQLDIDDVDLLADRIRGGGSFLPWLDEMFDVNSDSDVDELDLQTWIKDIKHSWFGDANLDGEFNSSDLVAVFHVGEYEDSIEYNSGWAAGDWDADGDFTSGDLVIAFKDGGYEKGPRDDVIAVPEPASFLMLIAGLISIATALRTRRRAI